MEEEKVFDEIWMVILILLALANDGAEIFFDVLAATGIGLPGEVIMELIDFIMDAFFTTIFFWKCGFGGPSMLQIADDVLEAFGVPGRTICVVTGIWMANHPNSSLGKVAQVASTLEGGELTAAVSEGKIGTAIGNAESNIASEGASSAKSLSASPSKTEQSVGNSNKRTNTASSEKEGSKKDNMASREEKDPMENLHSDVFEGQLNEGESSS